MISFLTLLLSFEFLGLENRKGTAVVQTFCETALAMRYRAVPDRFERSRSHRLISLRFCEFETQN